MNTSQACKKDLLPQYQASRSAKGKRALQKCIHPGDPWTIPAMKIPFHLEICHLKTCVIGVILFWQILVGWQKCNIYSILWLGPKYTQSILKPKPKQQKSSTSWIGGASAGPGVDNDQGLAVPRQLQGSWMGRKDSLMMPNANKTMRKQWEYVENGGKRSKSWWHRIVILDYPDTSRHPRSCLQDS